MLYVIRLSWWVIAVRGLLFTLFGLLAIFQPTLTLKVLMIYLGLIFLLSGLVSFYSGIRSRKYASGWWSFALLGIVDVLLAVLIFNNLGPAIEFFTMAIGVWALLMGGVLILVGTRIKNARIILYLNGLISLVFGIIILWRPMDSAETFTSLLGFFTTLFGLFVIYLGFKMRPGRQVEPPADAA